MPKTILFDMDDVLENLVECWTELLNKRHALSVKIEDIKSWTICDYFSIPKDDVYDVLFEDELWRSLEPKVGAIKTLKKLKDEGHIIKIVTNSHPWTVGIKSDWLIQNFPFLSWRDLIVTANKQMIMGDVLIDDNPDNLVGGNYKKLLFDRPWNSWCKDDSSEIIRVYNFDDIYREINKIANE